MTEQPKLTREQRIAAAIHQATTAEGRALSERQLQRYREHRKDAQDQHALAMQRFREEIEKFEREHLRHLAVVDQEIEILELGLAGSGDIAA